MSFFKKVISVIASFGVVFVLLTIVFLTVNSLDNNQNIELKPIETSMYLQEDVDESIWHEEDNTIYLMVLFKENHPKEYYLQYAYHYYDLYDKPVHLIAEDSSGSHIITVDSSGHSSLI